MKTKIWSLPDNVLQDLIVTAQGRVHQSPTERAALWKSDVAKAIREHGILDPLWNPQLQGKLF